MLVLPGPRQAPPYPLLDAQRALRRSFSDNAFFLEELKLKTYLSVVQDQRKCVHPGGV